MATNKDTKVVTGKVRFSFVHLFEPTAFEGQEPKYSVMILIPKTDKALLAKIKKAQKAAAEAGKEKFKGKIPANLKTTLRDGDEEYPDQPEFEGMMFMSVSSKTKPQIIDRNKDAITDSQEVYSGCYGRVSLNFYAYNTAGNKGISAGLNNVQKLTDGDFLGGRSNAEDDFDDDYDYESDEEDDML
ncbi:DUF2815 family protein [Listeria booriae]|uniref:DUF2815 family protein n=1 Tax=Listeria booriae TaxID=1552123 RepID=UPI001624812A|nr:DUF2815 family protein [Listeria booriae]MBC2149520.1 DUF2815 family protein [Listeria booriae]